jgi:uncharacterized membrane protein YeaQ/YmgE (transglycosylase-associated protein family)
MQETFPFVAGCVIGVFIQKIGTPKLKMVAFVVLCVIFGAIASFISGELSVSWGFLTVDAVLVWLGAFVSTSLIFGWRHRASWIRSFQK